MITNRFDSVLINNRNISYRKSILDEEVSFLRLPSGFLLESVGDLGTVNLDLEECLEYYGDHNLSRTQTEV